MHAVSIPKLPSAKPARENLIPGEAQDEAFEAIVIQATLDTLWSPASKTASGHVTEVNFMARYALALGFDPIPRLGPFPLGTHLGMNEAIMVVMRAMERGNKKSTVQWGTTRKARSTLTLLWEVSPEFGRDVVLSAAAKLGSLVATTAPVEGRWYQHFGRNPS